MVLILKLEFKNLLSVIKEILLLHALLWHTRVLGLDLTGLSLFRHLIKQSDLNLFSSFIRLSKVLNTNNFIFLTIKSQAKKTLITFVNGSNCSHRPNFFIVKKFFKKGVMGLF